MNVISFAVEEDQMGAKLGGGRGGKFDLGQNSEINVTPFVDVMLVLLIIFMVAVPPATTFVKLDLPPAHEPPKNQPVEEPTVIHIGQDALFIGDQSTSIATLSADLARAVNKPDPTLERVYLQAGRTVRYGRFMEVMNTLQASGYFQVALINEEL
jgi:biopolymer transport protein ExbD